MLTIILVLLLLVAVGVPYRIGGPDRGIYYGSGGLGFVLLVILVLWALGALGGGRPLRL